MARSTEARQRIVEEREARLQVKEKARKVWEANEAERKAAARAREKEEIKAMARKAMAKPRGGDPKGWAQGVARRPPRAEADAGGPGVCLRAFPRACV